MRERVKTGRGKGGRRKRKESREREGKRGAMMFQCTCIPLLCNPILMPHKTEII